ncbi:MAG: hypothetical protein ACI4K5_00095 [Ruminococcus sp.]
MLKKILDKKTCAECRLCCIFDHYDIWETPVFDEDTRNKLESLADAEFIQKDGGYIFKAEKFDDEGLFTCPALDPGKGCILGDEKPFDCRIWPYRIMKIGDKRVISIASICEAMYSKPLSELVEFLKDGLADKIFSYADSHPEIVKPYDNSYPILLVEK